MKFVLRKENGHFVAPDGSKQSYTPLLQRAKLFSSRAEAEQHKCENETVISLVDAVS